MATLDTQQRNSLPNSSFAGPDRSYPVDDKAHAINAKARATQQLEAGNLSQAQYSQINGKANNVLHRLMGLK